MGGEIIVLYGNIVTQQYFNLHLLVRNKARQSVICRSSKFCYSVNSSNSLILRVSRENSGIYLLVGHSN